MSDCPNSEIRDMLPDFVHGTVAGAERARVESHLASCDDCASEVSLLRAARGALSADVPSVDVASIVRVLPTPAPASRPSVPGVVSIDEARRARRAPARAAGWWRAAAVLLVAAGATTVAVLRSDFKGTPTATQSVAVARAGAGSNAGGGTSTVATPTVATTGLSLAAGVSELSDDELVALLGDIDDLDAAPATEPAALLPDMTEEGSQ